MREARGMSPEERIAEAAAIESAELLAVHANSWLRFIGENFESPIERLFALGFVSACFTKRDVVTFVPNTFSVRYLPEHEYQTLVHLTPQVSAGKARVDFSLSCLRYIPPEDDHEAITRQSRIAIECDGYEFHHGNPAAAARDKSRDRELAKHFDAILRFTGSELHANAYACACQAIAVAGAKLK